MATNGHIVVIGLGIVGCSIAATLARKGYRVTAIEQFPPLHNRGSSHGDTRIYRRIPAEGEVYAEMSTASWYGWREWNSLAQETLLTECGGVDAGPEDSEMVSATERLCTEYKASCEVLSAGAFNRKYPLFKFPKSWRMVYQRHSGFINAEYTQKFLAQMAQDSGGCLMYQAKITAIDPMAKTVSIGSLPEALDYDFLVIAAGPWLTSVLPELALPISTQRRVNAWYSPKDSGCLTDGRLPIFRIDRDGGWYGMPTPSGHLKIGHDKHFGEEIDPSTAKRLPDQNDATKLSACVDTYFEGFYRFPSSMDTCIYTLTPDRDFIIDRHPQHSSILVFSCCSGRGFKYAPAYGPIAADLISSVPRADLAPLSLNRSGLSIR